MADQTRMAVDTAKVNKAAQTGVPLSIMTYTLPHEMELYISDVLMAFLKELSQESLYDYLSYCVKELVTNAKKANTKRVYFREKQLNILDAADYEKGMKTFKSDTLQNIGYYLQLQKQAGLYVKVLFQVRDNAIKIEVRNNSELTTFEYKRVHDKLARAARYQSMEEAFSEALDETEGAGLGLIIMILMLEKVGLTDDNYQILCEDGETITRIILPLDTKTQDGLAVLSNEIVTMVTKLPQFPENITVISRLLNDPDSTLSDIAVHVSNDVALTGDLLRLVNSAAFSLSHQCHSISEAVKLVGITGLKNLLYSLGSMQVLGNSTAAQRDLWDHCYKTAFYASAFSKMFANVRSVADDAYVCGLLHDMGKIIFSNVSPLLVERMNAVCAAKSISAELFENMAAGINHAEVGALIAEKWNFPQTITQSIRYHHDPNKAPEDTQLVVAVVYVADMIIHYQDKSIDFYQMDESVLRRFNITTEAQLQKIAEALGQNFNAEKGK